MGRIIALANQKGGVGKTTTCVNLAASIAVLPRRVLLVDLDPQGNATMGCGIDKHEVEYSSYDVLVQNVAVERAVHTVPVGETSFHLLPSNANLTAAEVELIDAPEREQRLRKALRGLENYDIVLLDCPPSLSMITVNALVASHGVLIPMQCEYYALEGLSDLLNTVERVRANFNPSLVIEGLLRTMFDARNNLSNEVSAQLISHFADKVYRTVIPRNVRLAEAPSHGVPALVYDRTSRGALAYTALASEMLMREERQKTVEVRELEQIFNPE